MYSDKNLKYVKANSRAWDQVSALHRQASFKTITQLLRTKKPFAFSALEIKQLKELQLAGKKVAHLCCNSGVELISIERLGAGECVGFDISKKILELAREYADDGDGCEKLKCKASSCAQQAILSSSALLATIHTDFIRTSLL